MRIGKLFLSYNWTFGAAIIILTKVLLRYIEQESSAFHISGRGKYRSYKLYWPYCTLATNL